MEQSESDVTPPEQLYQELQELRYTLRLLNLRILSCLQLMIDEMRADEPDRAYMGGLLDLIYQSGQEIREHLAITPPRPQPDDLLPGQSFTPGDTDDTDATHPDTPHTSGYSAWDMD